MAKTVSARDQAYKPEELFRTGILPLDYLVRNEGGVPYGRFIEVSSPTGLGKSTMLLHMSANLCAQGINVDYMDFEDGVTDDIMAKMGLDRWAGEKLFHAYNPVTYAGFEEAFSQATKAGVRVVIVDSINNIVPSKFTLDAEGEKGGRSSVEDALPGLKARLDGQLVIRYKAECRSLGVTVFWVSQRRTFINMMNSRLTQDKAAVGKAFEHQMDIRIEGHRGERLIKEVQGMKGKDKIVYGMETFWEAIKNRGHQAFVKMPMPIIYGRGVSNIMFLKNALLQGGVVRQGGAVFKVKWNGEDIALRGNNGLNDWVKENLEEVKRYVIENGLIFLYKDMEGAEAPGAGGADTEDMDE